MLTEWSKIKTAGTLPAYPSLKSRISGFTYCQEPKYLQLYLTPKGDKWIYWLYGISEWEFVCFISKLIQRPPWHFSYLQHADFPPFGVHQRLPGNLDVDWDPWWLGKAGDQAALEGNPTCSCMEMGHALPETYKPGLTVLQSMVESPWSSSSTDTCMATKGIVSAFLVNQEQTRNKNWRSDKNYPSFSRTWSSHSFNKFMLDTQEYFLKNAEKYSEHSPVCIWYTGNVWQTTVSHPSGFTESPWQCCHCLKYCLSPNKKAIRNVPTPAIVKDVYCSVPWTLSKVSVDTKSSLLIATSPGSSQVLSSHLCFLLIIRPLGLPFYPGCPGSFWQGKNLMMSSLMMKLCSPGSVHIN